MRNYANLCMMRNDAKLCKIIELHNLRPPLTLAISQLKKWPRDLCPEKKNNFVRQNKFQPKRETTQYVGLHFPGIHERAMNVRLFKFKQRGQPRGVRSEMDYYAEIRSRSWNYGNFSVSLKNKTTRKMTAYFSTSKKNRTWEGGKIGGNNKCHLLIGNESCGKMRTGYFFHSGEKNMRCSGQIWGNYAGLMRKMRGNAGGAAHRIIPPPTLWGGEGDGTDKVLIKNGLADGSSGRRCQRRT